MTAYRFGQFLLLLSILYLLTAEEGLIEVYLFVLSSVLGLDGKSINKVWPVYHGPKYKKEEE